MQWIKEVELVDSVDEFKKFVIYSFFSMPNFEVLDARIASALNKIIHNSKFKRRISLEEQKAQKEDRFLRGRQIAYLIYDHFRVTGTHYFVENRQNDPPSAAHALPNVLTQTVRQALIASVLMASASFSLLQSLYTARLQEMHDVLG